MISFGRNQRLGNDLAQALALDPSLVCNELGLYHCTDLVHAVALGGTDPYVTGLYEPLPETGLSSPIAADRVVLAACVQRVDLDFADPAGAVIFKDLPVAEGGKLNVTDPLVTQAIDTLAKRSFARHATSAEVTHIKGLYQDLETAGAGEPARTWALMSCYALLTTAEFLFY